MENENFRNRDSLMAEIFGSYNESLFEENSEHEHQSNSDKVESIRIVKVSSNNLNVEVGPQASTIFESIDSLFTAYQHHARHKGFSIVKRARHKVNGEDKYALINCDRGRKPCYEKSSKRINCPARINAIKKENRCWMVSKIRIDHNYDLEPEMTILMARHRSLSVNMKRQLEANDIAGIRPYKNVRLLEVQAGGPKNLGCLPTRTQGAYSCRTFLST